MTLTTEESLRRISNIKKELNIIEESLHENRTSPRLNIGELRKIYNDISKESTLLSRYSFKYVTDIYVEKSITRICFSINNTELVNMLTWEIQNVTCYIIKKVGLP